VQAVKQIAKRHSINIITFSTDWALADRSTFVMGFMPFSQVDRISQFAIQRGYKNFAVISPKDQYGNMVTQRFEEKVRALGGNITNSIRFTPGDPAVINQIAALKPADGQAAFNAVFMPVGGSQTETISSALSYNKLMPMQVKRIGTGLWDDPRIASQPNMQGAWFAGPSPQARQRFEQQYKNTYGVKPIRLATLAYDATSLASILARNGFQQGNAPDFSYAALTNPNGFAGTDGIFRFNPNGMVERGLAVLEIRNGGIVEIAPAPKQF
jgi:ABC-type branched-subunit amino acid transport system substrate-binding protein